MAGGAGHAARLFLLLGQRAHFNDLRINKRHLPEAHARLGHGPGGDAATAAQQKDGTSVLARNGR
eukprot:4029215-Pleurochrysis_carterae.AAC.3